MSIDDHTPLTLMYHTEPDGVVDASTTAVFDAWLSTLGPSTTLLWWYLARKIGDRADTFTVDELAKWSGLGPYQVTKSITRLVGFGRATFTPDGNGLSVVIVSDMPRQRRSPTLSV